MPARTLPPSPSLAQLKKQAKTLLKAHRAGSAEAVSRLRASVARLADASDAEIENTRFALHDARFAIAREYGFDHWQALEAHVSGTSAETPTGIEAYFQAVRANDLDRVQEILEVEPALVHQRVADLSAEPWAPADPGDRQGAAKQIQPAPKIKPGGKPRGTQGQAHGSCSPGAPDAVRNDHRQIASAAPGQFRTEFPCTGIGINGQQQNLFALFGGSYIGFVYPRIGHDQTEAVFDHQDARAVTDHFHRFAQNKLHQPGILLHLFGQAQCLGRRGYVRQGGHSSLAFGDYFLGQNEYIARGRLFPHGFAALQYQSGQIIPRLDHGQPWECLELEVGPRVGHGAAGGGYTKDR